MKKLLKGNKTEIEILMQKQMRQFTEIINKILLESCAKGRCNVKNCKV